MTARIFLVRVAATVLLLQPLSGLQRTQADALGTMLRQDDPPQRIVSLAPNITEILFALDLGHQIIGVTRFCDFPPAALAVDRIGGLVDPNLEKILSLKPDLIIGFRGNPLRVIRRMQEFNLPVFVLETGITLDSVFSVIENVARITWTEHRGAELTRPLKLRLREIRAALNGIQKRPKVFVFLHGLGLWTCGKGSFMDELVREAGGQNIAGAIEKKWLLFSREKLIAEDPEYIVVLAKSPEAFLEAKKTISESAYLQHLSAVEKGRVFFLDENLATRPGPRIFEALEILAGLLHPETFPKK